MWSKKCRAPTFYWRFGHLRCAIQLFAIAWGRSRSLSRMCFFYLQFKRTESGFFRGNINQLIEMICITASSSSSSSSSKSSNIFLINFLTCERTSFYWHFHNYEWHDGFAACFLYSSSLISDFSFAAVLSLIRHRKWRMKVRKRKEDTFDLPNVGQSVASIFQISAVILLQFANWSLLGLHFREQKCDCG